MVIAIPLAASEPISISQEALYQIRPIPPMEQIGVASWYSETDPGINRHTANGEFFDDSKLTCASWHHAFGTLLKITNLKNGKSVVCRVNDRGPNKRLGRLVDLTLTAFRYIAEPRTGLIHVSIAQISD